jgi:hypothetical protein
MWMKSTFAACFDKADMPVESTKLVAFAVLGGGGENNRK